MAVRTQQEINEIGFDALVRALGKDDALRFIRGISGVRPAGNMPVGDDPDPLPPMTPDEIHMKIMDMQEPDNQASLL